MAKPLRSDEVVNPKDIQFKHFGVLDDGAQSKTSVFTSLTLNVLLAIVAIILGAAAKKVADDNVKLVTINLPVKEPPPPEPPRIKIVPPKLPKPPVVKIEPPKIPLPEPVKVAEIPRPPTPKMPDVAPVMRQPAPKLIIAPPAPKVVSLARAPQAASVVNNSPHPSAVALGRADNPIAPSNAPAVSSVNLGNRGLAGMPSTNTGGGPPAAKVNLGNGSPGGGPLNGNGLRPVEGVSLGQRNGSGPLNGPVRAAGPVDLGARLAPPPQPHPPAAASAVVSRGPKVLYKPTPVYTEEAKNLHLTGSVSIRIRVSASGSVSVIGVTNGLGHGLDESAIRAIQATRFSPALDSNGSPTAWEGVVNVNFLMAE